MKVYVFYMVANSTGLLDVPRMYAVTHKKHIAQGFKESRNMKYFLLKEYEQDDDEFKLHADKYRNYILGTRGFTTRSKDSINGQETVYITATQGEEEHTYIQSENVTFELGKHTVDNSEIFNDDIVKSLNDLQYFEMYRFYRDSDAYFYSGLEDFTRPEDFDWKIDMLALFLYYYGYTMNLKK